jgi:hypothetical protein
MLMNQSRSPFHEARMGALAAALLLCARPGVAQTNEAARLEQAARATAQDASRYFARPGLLADRETGRLHILAETTALTPGSPCEFFLVATNSGHGYESLALALAKPSDIHDALLSLGLPAGQAYDPALPRLWPKGERVFLHWLPATNFGVFSSGPGLPLEALIADRRTNATPVSAGLVFTGSRRIPDPDRPDATLYEADSREPNSIASTYNDPGTVLDIPRRATQTEEYGEISVSTNFLAWTNRLVTVLITPENPAKTRRVLETTLRVEPAPTNAAGSAAPLLHWLDDKAQPLSPSSDLRGLVQAVGREVAAGRDPFATILFSPALPLHTVREVCVVIISMESEQGLRVEPPAAGQLYYKAFLPREEFRDRAARMAQPWELRLTRAQGAVTGVLTRIEEVWVKDVVAPTLSVSDHPAPTPAILRGLLEHLRPGLPVVLVFADADLTYGELTAFLQPVRKTHPTIHVYLVEAAGGAPQQPPSGPAH